MENKNQDKNENKDKGKNRTQGTAKITVTKQAENLLEDMLRRINEGFDGGRVTRQDLVSWVLTYFHRECFPESIEAIRREHFDRIAYLEHVLKQAKAAKRGGAEAADLNALLEPILSTEPDLPQRKRTPVRKTRKPEQLEMGETA